MAIEEAQRSYKSRIIEGTEVLGRYGYIRKNQKNEGG